MAEPSRGQQISRRSWLLAGLTVPLFSARGADPITVTFDGDNLHLASPDLHFLAGKPLERMKEGSTVVYQVNIGLYRDQWTTLWKRAEVKFAVSYDVWGEAEKFAVAMSDVPSRRADNLSKAATEAWCLDHIWIAVQGIAPDRQFWLQLEVRVGSQRNLAKVLGDGGISVDLIEMASAKSGADAPMSRKAGPFRLADLVRTPGRGRNG